MNVKNYPKFEKLNLTNSTKDPSTIFPVIVLNINLMIVKSMKRKTCLEKRIISKERNNYQILEKIVLKRAYKHEKKPVTLPLLF